MHLVIWLFPSFCLSSAETSGPKAPFVGKVFHVGHQVENVAGTIGTKQDTMSKTKHLLTLIDLCHTFHAILY